MFSGIVEEIGAVRQIVSKENLSVLEIQARTAMKEVKRGASIAVDGVCLTVRDIKGKTLVFDMMRETLMGTTLGLLKKGNPVNLERALKANSRIDGHFVTGHIDAIGTVKKKIVEKNYIELQIESRRDVIKYVAVKGSVCLDGVSLTVGKVSKKYFSVHLIPFTNDHTTLGRKKVGGRVNIETDILAKYVLNSKRT